MRCPFSSDNLYVIGKCGFNSEWFVAYTCYEVINNVLYTAYVERKTNGDRFYFRTKGAAISHVYHSVDGVLTDKWLSPTHKHAFVSHMSALA